MAPLVQRPRLLAVGQGAAATGFSRVLHSLFERLRYRWDIHHFALNYRGPRLAEPWTIYPNEKRGDVYGLDQLGPLLAAVRPRLVLLLEDLEFLPLHLEIVRRASTARTVVYVPMDFEAPPPPLAASLAAADRVVAYNGHGKGILTAAAPELAVEVIPHGIDAHRFHPLPEPGRPEGEFVVLNANRNQPRKRIDLTIRGFARFAAGKPPGVQLHLHMGMQDQGIDIPALVRELGIEDRLRVTTRESGPPALPDAELNRLYNACHVGLNTAVAEGWGLVSFEHAATGAPQIVPGHGACRELWEGSALLLDAPVPTVEGVAAALEALYRDSDLRRRMSAAAFANATRGDLTWDAIAERWHELFLSTMNEPGNEIVSRGTNRAPLKQEAR